MTPTLTTTSMQRIDGKAIAAGIAQETAARVAALGFTPGLGVVLVGDDAASSLYVSLKERAAAAAGIAFFKAVLPASATLVEILEAVRGFNADPAVHGIIVQLPLPDGIDSQAVIDAIDPRKDADGFHPENAALFAAGTPRVPPVLTACIMALIASTGGALAGKRAAVVGNSAAFFEPLRTALEAQGASAQFVSAADTRGCIALTTKSAEIVVVAAGKPGLIGGDMLSDWATVIDVGTTPGADGKVHGDVDTASCAPLSGWLTPVPGGVGPVTVAMLLRNVVALAEQEKR